MKTNKILSLAAIASCALVPAVTHATPVVVNSFGDVSTVSGFSGDYGGSGISTVDSAYTQVSGLVTPNALSPGTALLSLTANDRYSTGGPVTYVGNNTFDASGPWDVNFFEGFFGGASGLVTLNYGEVGGPLSSIIISAAGIPYGDSWYAGFSFLTGAGFGSSYNPSSSTDYEFSLSADTSQGIITSQTIYVDQNPTSVPDKTATLPLLGVSMAGMGFVACRRKKQQGSSQDRGGSFVATA
jgi:hypothetical protein